MTNTILLLTFFSIGCLTDQGAKLPDSVAVPVDSIKSISITGKTVSAVVWCTVPTPCWGFVRTDQTVSGNNVHLKIFARNTTNDPCIQVLGSIEAPVRVTVPSAGSYTFRFWRYNNTTLDTTIAIP